MNAPGKSLLKVVSILNIIFGAIAAIVSITALAALTALSGIAGAAADAVGSSADAAAAVTAASGVAIVSLVLALIDSVLALVFGIIGVGKRSGDPSKGGFYIVSGVILCALSLISMILSMAFTTSGFPWSSLVNFVLPILYIVGGNMNKKAAVTQ